MFFEEHEKKIYRPPEDTRFNDRLYDPLRIDRLLTIISENRLNELITLRNPSTVDSGDVSKEGRKQALVQAAQAELELADIARKVFELPPFPDTLDGECLELLYDYMEWMEGKGERARKPQESLTTIPEYSESTPTLNS